MEKRARRWRGIEIARFGCIASSNRVGFKAQVTQEEEEGEDEDEQEVQEKIHKHKSRRQHCLSHTPPPPVFEYSKPHLQRERS